MERLLNQEEMRKILGLNRRVFIGYRRQGMPHIKVNERTYRFNPEEVIAWFKERTQNLQEEAK